MMRGKTERERMLCDISIVGFTVVDLTLYLDTHCDDKKALEYFQHYRKVQNRLEHEYAAKYGPLNLATATENCNNEWTWGNMPLPWEGVC